MINKIIASYILFSCLIAVALKLGGVENTIHLGTFFRSYLVQSNLELQEYKISIPEIPHIPYIKSSEAIFADGWDFWEVVRWYLKIDTSINNIIRVLNGLVNVLNILIIGVNTLIQVIELLFIFLKNIIVMRDNIIIASSIV